jgi:hypothetical protein
VSRISRRALIWLHAWDGLPVAEAQAKFQEG